MLLKTAMPLQATYIMQTLLMDIWNTMRRAQAAAKRIRDEELGESSDAQDAAPPKRQRLDTASASSPAEVDRTLCCLHMLKPHVTPHGLGSGAATIPGCLSPNTCGYISCVKHSLYPRGKLPASS